MMQRWRLFAVVGVLLGSPTVLAQGVTADLSLRVVEGLPSLTLPGSQGTFQLEITNNGPGSVVAPAFYSISVSFIPFMDTIEAQDAALFFAVPPESDCLLEWDLPDVPPDYPSIITFGIFPDQLPAGETRVCEIFYFVGSEFDFAADERTNSGSLDVEWYISPLGYTDPNPDNDAVVLPFRFWLTSRPIPTLGPFGLALMAAGIIGAFVALRRSRRPSG